MNALKAMNKTKCEKCLERIKKEAERQIIENTLKNEYKYATEIKDATIETIVDGVSTVHYAAIANVAECDPTIYDENGKLDVGRFITAVFEKAVMYSSISDMFGNKIDNQTLQKPLIEKYGLDFSRLEFHWESEDDYKSRYYKEFPND